MSNPTATTAPTDKRDELREQLKQAVGGLDIYTSEMPLPGEQPIADLRRSRGGRADDRIGVATLMEVDDVLVWDDGVGAVALPTPVLPGRRGRFLQSISGTTGTVIERTRFDQLQPNQICQFLQKLDLK